MDKRNSLKYNRIIVGITVLILLLGNGAIAATITPLISYQGILKDSNSNLISGNVAVTFKIYNNSTVGSLLWQETKNVQVNSGLFNTQLGDVTPLNAAQFDQALWLEITVGADTLSPRQQLMGVPYAFSLAPGAVISNTTHDHYGRYANSNQGCIVGKVVTGVDAGGNLVCSDISSSAGLETRVLELERILVGVNRTGKDIYFNGTNVHITDGSGSTDGKVNGLGNLIIGYNELRGSSDFRSGSHNLILGMKNNYRSFGGFVGGLSNDISGSYASISGGVDNTASGDYSSVSAGEGNMASGGASSVNGGYYNTASGGASSVSGGYYNTASNDGSSVGGGNGNTANGPRSLVSGGAGNIASGQESSVSGGYYNTASGQDSSVSGGWSNTASGTVSSINGGENNTASGWVSSVSGGYGSVASGQYSSVSGGQSNIASGEISSVNGGDSNTASGMYSSVSGGQSNTASGMDSSVSGGSLLNTTKNGEWATGNINSYGNNVYFNKTNVHITSGIGATDGAVNGLGNLIIGYNELRGSGDNRSGSHNLVLGSKNNFASYGGMVAGTLNEISGQYASVSGGEANKASGMYSSVSGGSSILTTESSEWATGNINSYGSDIYFNKTNVHITSGIGATNGAVNGLGNLIIGYNELRGSDDNRIGSHNLVIGSKNNFASYGGMVAGTLNEISGQYASVSGGEANTASGPYSSVSGGSNNIANYYDSSISGGYKNKASGLYASVSGGEANTASGSYSSVSGGSNNIANYYDTSISGGHKNKASAVYSSVSGGDSNIAIGESCSVSGGTQNIAGGQFSSISGGSNNIANYVNSSISGGKSNMASGRDSSVSGGLARNAYGENDWNAGALFQDS